MKRVSMFAVAMCGVLLVGCGVGGGGTDPFANLDDLNANGYPELVPPEGVSLDDGTINVGLKNTITTEEAAAMAEAYGFPGSAVGFVQIKVDLTLDYGNDITADLSFTKSMETFEEKFEAACPLTVYANVEVVANVPFVGEQSIVTQAFELPTDFDFDCGQTISIETFMNDAGTPDVIVDIS